MTSFSKAAKLAVLAIARTTGVFRLCRLLTSRRVRILCYHGGAVGDEDKFNSLLFCPAQLIRTRLTWLRQCGFTIISLDDAVNIHLGKLAAPAYPVAVTFDDGWFSTYSELHPVVGEMQVPATLYLSTGHYREDRPNIEVAVSYIAWKRARSSVEIEGFGAVDGRYDLSDRKAELCLTQGVTAWLKENCRDRKTAYEGLERFAGQLGVSTAVLDLASRRFDFVNRAELHELASAGWTIELHGHEHSYPLGDPDEFERDLQTCREVLRQEGFARAKHYCYPSGECDRFAGGVLSSAGVKSAVTCRPGLVGGATTTDLYYLPRFVDGGEIHKLEFEAELSGFSDFVRLIAGAFSPGQSREPSSRSRSPLTPKNSVGAP